MSSFASSLDVALLLDDPGELAGQEGSETFLAVSEAVDAIEKALLALGHRPRRIAFSQGTLEVITQLAVERPDVVFHLGQPSPTDPAGEAQVTGLLEMLGLPHTSESSETLVLARDKARAKALFAHHGITTPGHAVSQRGELPRDLPEGPWIAKPAQQDGSLGIDCVQPATNRDALQARVEALHARFAEPILIETFVGGREFQIGLVGREILPVVELDFSELPSDRPKLAGYESKWKYDSVEFKGTHFRCPAEISPELHTQIRDLTYKTSRAFGLRRCSRLDMRMDDAGRVHVLDVNPNPDLSPIATMHAMAKAAGWGFDGMVQRMLDLARTERSRNERAGFRSSRGG